MFCPQCGAQAAANYRFCARCGAPLTAVAPLTEPAAAAPEAAVDVYAPFWPRAGALVIDYLLVVLGCAFLRGLLGIRLDSGASVQVFFWTTVLVLWLYKAIAERSARQATLGKLAFDLKVTSLRGERIGLLRALVRNLTQALSAVIMFIGFLMPAFTRRRQALHDMCAGTLVTRRQFAPPVIAAAAEGGTASAPPGLVPPAAKRESRVSPDSKRRPAKIPAQPAPVLPAVAQPERVAARPELPVRLSFPDALIGPDKRAVLENLSDSALEVVLDVKSPVTGAHFTRTFVINPRSFGQVGRAQGWRFVAGQLVTVTHPQYRPLVQTVS